MPFTYEYPRPNLTVDIILFVDTNPDEKRFADRVSVLLIKRRDDPFQGCWAIPGGFVNEQEDLEAAAHREMGEETNVKNLALRQVCAVGTPHRDPRGHTVSVVFTAHEKQLPPEAKAGDDAAEMKLVRLDEILHPVRSERPKLAFDHESLIVEAYNLWVSS